MKEYAEHCSSRLLEREFSINFRVTPCLKRLVGSTLCYIFPLTGSKDTDDNQGTGPIVSQHNQQDDGLGASRSHSPHGVLCLQDRTLSGLDCGRYWTGTMPAQLHMDGGKSDQPISVGCGHRFGSHLYGIWKLIDARLK